jgi:hypothetical protein
MNSSEFSYSISNETLMSCDKSIWGGGKNNVRKKEFVMLFKCVEHTQQAII